MNFGDSKNSELIKYIGINQSTFYDKLKRKSFTPNELEKIAEFFNKPISYYFDRDEPVQLNEKDIKYGRCLECEKKQEEIEKLRKEVDDLKNELLQVYRGQKGEHIATSA